MRETTKPSCEHCTTQRLLHAVLQICPAAQYLVVPAQFSCIHDELQAHGKSCQPALTSTGGGRQVPIPVSRVVHGADVTTNTGRFCGFPSASWMATPSWPQASAACTRCKPLASPAAVSLFALFAGSDACSKDRTRVARTQMPEPAAGRAQHPTIRAVKLVWMRSSAVVLWDPRPRVRCR